MLIYISGPLSNDNPEIVKQNINAAIDAGIILLSIGHTPIIPHFTQYMADRIDELKKHQFDSESKMHVQIRMMGEFNQSNRSWVDLNIFQYDFWLLYDFRLIDACDGLLYLGPSKGADMEKIYALHTGKKVYLSIDEIISESAIADKGISDGNKLSAIADGKSGYVKSADMNNLDDYHLSIRRVPIPDKVKEFETIFHCHKCGDERVISTHSNWTCKKCVAD